MFNMHKWLNICINVQIFNYANTSHKYIHSVYIDMCPCMCIYMHVYIYICIYV